MKFRKPIKEDIETLKNISTNFKKQYDWAKEIPIANIDTDKKAKERLFSDDIENILIAAENNKMVGYLAVKKFIVDEKIGYEASIIIDSKFRGNGLAKKMTNMVFNNISKDKVVEAWVHQNNVPSLQTVKSLGFKFVKHFKDDKMIRIFTKYGNKQGD